MGWRGYNTDVVHSLILSREGLILTLSILPCPQGWISWSIPVDELMMRRMSVLHQNSGGIGKSIPSALQISLDPRDFPRASPSGDLSGLGKSLGRRGPGMDFPIPPSSWWSTDTISHPVNNIILSVFDWLNSPAKLWFQESLRFSGRAVLRCFSVVRPN